MSENNEQPIQPPPQPQKKNISISVIPTPKLTVLLNNFIYNTVNHLNKLSIDVDDQLQEFDKKLNDLEIMTTLFETKLNSLPDDLKSLYPNLQPCNLDDVNPIFSVNANPNSSSEQQQQPSGNIPVAPPMDLPPQEQNQENVEVKEEKKEEEQVEITPEVELENFFCENEEYRSFLKMLKYGVPVEGVKQKAMMAQLDLGVFEEMLKKIHNAYPSIV